MKVGTENKTKTIIAAVLVVLAILMVWRAFTGNEENSTQQTNPASVAAKPSTATGATTRRSTTERDKHHPLLAETLDPTLRFDLLKSSEDVTYKGSGRDIFSSQAPPPEIPKVITPPVKTGPPPPPPPPPINLKVYGYTTHENGQGKRIFLVSGDDIFVAKEGDIVDRRYRILKINKNSVDVEDVLTNNRQTLSISAG